MNTQVATLLDKTPKNATKMTQNLALLGDGDMGAGIRMLWSNGFCNGAFSSVVVISIGLLVYQFAARQQRTINTIETAFTTGYEAGKKYERDYQGYLKRKEGEAEWSTEADEGLEEDQTSSPQG